MASDVLRDAERRHKRSERAEAIRDALALAAIAGAVLVMMVMQFYG